ncbi:MAG TPA: ABC transporter permease [Puia sp.]|nr:ABC transporter permease [Puia sp.]
MFKNYCKIAWRNLLKGKAYSSINIIGLATGMAIALLIGLWIADETSFDSYHSNHKRLAQVMLSATMKGETYTGQTIAMPLGQALRTGYSDLFKRVALISFPGDHVLASGDKKISGAGMWTQPEFPEMFTFQMIYGNAGALKDPSSILLAKSLAKALFGDTDPVNKPIRLDNKIEMKVGGVYEDLPHNTSFYDTKLLLPWDNKENGYLNTNTDWVDHNGQLFVQLADNVGLERGSARIKNLPTPHIKGWHEEVMLHPLDKLHLYTEFRNGKAAGGRIQFVWLFGIIGGFVLLLACINFMNLSTARSEKRAKEVGIRKTVGSLRGQLIGQFLSESILVAFISLGVAILLVQGTLPFFNSLAAKEMSLPWSNLLFWVLAIVFTLFTGIVSGSYPAFYLSGFEPVKVLKGTFRAGRNASLPRQILVVLQFTVSLTLIIGTIIVFRQIQFAKDRPIGYSREGLITVGINTPELNGHYEALRADLLQTGKVDNMAESSQPTTYFMNNNELEWRNKDPNLVVFFRNVNVTPEFGKTIHWSVQQGRDFSRSFATDSNSMILNEAAAKATGIKNPVGELMKFGGKQYTVIGVVKDLVTQSPFDPIEPAIFLGDGYLDYITIRVKPGMSMRKALAGMEPVFKKYNPGSPFIYKFNDESYSSKFAAEERIGNLATVFAGFAIFISCLGLFGLASFVAEQRTKEIGVRKVLGADLLTLWGLLSRDFVKLVFISLFAAIPLAYYVMNQWLQGYAYRTGMPWWIFAVAGAGLLLLTVLTVSYQSLKAALMNPVKSLRSE